MGRKRAGAWEYVYFCATCLILFSLFHCAAVKDFMKEREARRCLLRGNDLLARKDYQGALREYQKVVSMSPHRPEEAEALFNVGLIHAHFGYPLRNYEKSLQFFVRVLNDHPESPLVEQARIWAGVLQEHKRINQKLEKLKATPIPSIAEEPKKPESKPAKRDAVREHLLRGQRLFALGDYEGSISENEKVLSLSARRSPEDEALLNLGLIYAHPENPRKDYGMSLQFFKRLIEDYPGSPLAEPAKAWVEMLRENEELSQVIQKLKQVDIEIEERRREKAK